MHLWCCKTLKKYGAHDASSFDFVMLEVIPGKLLGWHWKRVMKLLYPALLRVVYSKHKCAKSSKEKILAQR